MTYGYIRFSTEHQEETQQMFSLKEYASQRGLTIDAFEKDEGVSGGVSYKDRKLYNLIRKMKPGDTLITTEISRLGRSMSDLNKLVNDELVPRKIRLIVAKMGLDLNCSNLTAVDQMVIYAFGFSAQLEKEMIQQRTQAAIDARKDAIAKNGGFISKTGKWCKKLGRSKGADNTNAVAAAALAKGREDEKWKSVSPLYSMVKYEVARGSTHKQILAIAEKFYNDNPTAYCTKTGKRLCASTLSRWMKEIRFGM